MTPLAVAATEYGAVASRGAFSRLTDAVASPDLDTLAWAAAVVAVVVFATRRSWRLVLLLLVICGALGAKVLDLW
jgi:hypothetical protein